MITALGGGVGAAKFLEGLSKIIQLEKLTIIINTGDDINKYGVRVSPDIDTIIYRLSGMIDNEKGWGIAGDSFNCLESLSKLDFETWFQLGDKDFATQLKKTFLKNKGHTQTEITSIVAEEFGITKPKLLPMSDDEIETWIETEIGEIHFQEYYIKHKMQPAVFGINIRGIRESNPAPGVIESIESAELIIICPSNPIISIGPILKVRGVRDTLMKSNATKIAVSPLIGGKPLKGPADRLMKGLGLEPSSTEIANLYRDFLDIMVIDSSDSNEKDEIESLGVKTLITNTVMSDNQKSSELSKTILDFVGYEL